MKNKIIGILVCMLLIAAAVLPVIEAVKTNISPQDFLGNNP